MTSALHASTPSLGVITPYILAKDIAHLRETCKQWQECIDNTESIWQQLFENEGIPKVDNREADFKSTFQFLYARTVLSRRTFEETFQATLIGEIPPVTDRIFTIAKQMIDPVLIVFPKWVGSIPAYKEDFDRRMRRDFRHGIGPDEYAAPLTLQTLIDLCNPKPSKERFAMSIHKELTTLEKEEQILKGFPTRNYHPQVYLIERRIPIASRGDLAARMEYYETYVQDTEFELPPLLLRALLDVTLLLRKKECPDASESYAIVQENYVDEQTGENYLVCIGGHNNQRNLEIRLEKVGKPYIKKECDLGIVKCGRVDIEPPIDNKVQFEVILDTLSGSIDDDLGASSSSDLNSSDLEADLSSSYDFSGDE